MAQVANPVSTAPSGLPANAAAASQAAVSAAKASAGATTVFDSATDFSVKHPLSSKWQLWFDAASKADKNKSWEDQLVKVHAFDSVEAFWGLYNHIVPPSHAPGNSSYYLFRDGIFPAWEDPANASGGKWSIQFPRNKYSATIDELWLNTLLAAIGETFEVPYDDSYKGEPAENGEVTGIILSSRKAFFRINLWTRSAAPEDKDKIENIGRQLKYNILQMRDDTKMSERDKVSTNLEFSSHKDSQNKALKVPRWTL